MLYEYMILCGQKIDKFAFGRPTARNAGFRPAKKDCFFNGCMFSYLRLQSWEPGSSECVRSHQCCTPQPGGP